MKQNYYPKHIIEAVDEKIELAACGRMPPMTAWLDIKDTLQGNTVPAGCSIKVEKLKPRRVFVHETNRGGLGLNAHQSHENGAKIVNMGVQLEELEKGVNFERIPFEPYKSIQYDFNCRPIEHGKGLFAQLTGHESHCSVGTGHTTAFFRAAEAGCKTPEPSLQDADKKLNYSMLCRDQRFKEACEQGWNWTVIPWQAQLQWPKLPNLVQGALNAINNTSSQQSELECCVTIALYDSQRSPENTFDECVAAVRQNNPLCKAYLDKIGKLAQVCGGGEGVPLVRLMDRFQKTYGASKTLGNEFLSGVVDLYISELEPLTYCRVACVMANLASDKTVDGISKLITKTNVDKLKSKNMVSRAIALNKDQEKAYKLCQEHLEKGNFGEEAHDEIIGMFFVRSMLFLLGRGIDGPERKTYKDLTEVIDLFVSDCTEALGADVVVDPSGEWVPKLQGAAHAAAAAVSSSKDEKKMLTAEELRDPARVMGAKGFELGSVVYEKVWAPKLACTRSSA